MKSLYGSDIDVFDLSDRLLYSKAEKWSSEDESRIVCPLTFCEKKIGPLVQPDFGDDFPFEQSSIFKEYSEINLKKYHLMLLNL